MSAPDQDARSKPERLRMRGLVAGAQRILIGQDVDEIAAGIKARGGKLESEPEDTSWGPRAFSLRDPDGFALTIMSEM